MPENMTYAIINEKNCYISTCKVCKKHWLVFDLPTKEPTPRLDIHLVLPNYCPFCGIKLEHTKEEIEKFLHGEELKESINL